ncbi:MAG: Ig-like domain-containing protein, partial [Methanobrevibacter sp.]|nr:Ig-like domain-containing protein [Methanobrevibacter sp.]
MKYKKTIILLALVVFLLSIAGVSASEIDNTIASENANTIELSTDNDIEDNLQTSEENEALASTDYDEDIAQTDTEVLGADSAKYSDLAEEISQPGNITLTHKSYTYDERATAITISEANKVIDGNGAVIDMNGLTIRAFTVTASGVTIKNLTIKNANYNVNGGAIYFNSTGTVTNCNFTNNKATGDYSSGGAIFFVNTGTVTNCNFTNNKATGDYSSGGAISFSGTGTVSNCSFTGNTARNGGAINMGSGTVSNCNFTDNTATYEGGAVWMSSGTVSNCNFTNNTARYGGAVCFNREGAVTNCNFTNNSARYGGAVEFDGTGNVTNCNFTGNTAIDDGGAVFFLNTGNVTNCNFADNHASGDGGAINMGSGTVTNCNFADNTAYRGGAIFSNQWYTAADTCIFKRNSGDNVNTVIYLPTLNVDNFTTVYGSGEKLTFDLKTNSSIPVTNGNILISVYFKDNGEWVRNYTCLSGEGWIPDLPVGSYIAVFNTEYAEFQRINRTIIITLPNVRYSINVTSLTTNNKTVNITSKTDIPKDILWDGKLLFILPNSEEINASYATNGTWWALYTFNDAGDYNVNASYTGLDGVIINNATISIKYDTSVDVNNKTLDLLIDDTFTIVATTTPEGLNVTFTPDNSSVVSVDENGLVTALKEGTASITVKVGGDSKYTENSTTVAVTVSKIPTEITVNPASLNMFVGDETVIVANLTPADAGNVTFTSDDENIVIVDDQGNVIANGKGQAIITVIFEGDNKYAASENKTITVDVSLNDASVTVDNDTLDLKVDETYAINATKHPDTILLDITYKSS